MMLLLPNQVVKRSVTIMLCIWTCSSIHMMRFTSSTTSMLKYVASLLISVTTQRIGHKKGSYIIFASLDLMHSKLLGNFEQLF
jgi:hypothetical protein